MSHASESPADLTARVLTAGDDVYEFIEDGYVRYCLMEQANLISEDVARASREAYGRWNDFAADVKPDVEGIVRQQLAEPRARMRVEKSLVDRLDWIVLQATVEVQFRRYCGRHFHQTLVRWLLRGHLCLGWELGQYPAGRAVIY